MDSVSRGCFQSYQCGIEISSFPQLSCQHSLSIVPMWNWNYVVVKWPHKCCQLSIVPMWNWNLRIAIDSFLVQSFNRTNVELKWIGSGCTGTTNALSIVPMWNWNRAVQNVIIDKEDFQSYQCGIEILAERPQRKLRIWLSIVPMWNWNHLGNLKPDLVL